jgi:AI-2 transport protein TqsA
VSDLPPLSSRATSTFQGLFAAAALVLVIAGLREASTILVPVVFAGFITVLLAPVVSLLRRYGVPVAIAIPLLILALIAVVFLVGSFVGSSLNAFAVAMPRYQEKVLSIVSSLTLWSSRHGIRTNVAKLIASVDTGKVLAIVGNALTQLASLLSYTLLVLLMVVFLLFDAVDLPARLRLALRRPEEELEQVRHVASEIKHYIVLKTYLCLTTSSVTLIVLYVMGVDFAPLWAVLALILGYVPNIGPFVASAPPVLLALLQRGPGHMMMVLGLLATLHTVVGNVVEPQLLGRRLGLSSFVVFVSLIIWGWIWGAGGMLLSVPLTMTIKILLENSREWRWLAVLMGSGPETQRVAPAPNTQGSPPNR